MMPALSVPNMCVYDKRMCVGGWRSNENNGNNESKPNDKKRSLIAQPKQAGNKQSSSYCAGRPRYL